MSNSDATNKAIQETLKYLMSLSGEELRAEMDRFAREGEGLGLTESDMAHYVNRIMGKKNGEEKQ